MGGTRSKTDQQDTDLRRALNTALDEQAQTHQPTTDPHTLAAELAVIMSTAEDAGPSSGPAPADMVAWRKSSHSDMSNAACVEVARLGYLVGVRDSKDPEGVPLGFTSQEFSGLLVRIKRGELALHPGC